MSKQRIQSADIAKGIAILSIIVGHIGFFAADGTELTQPWLYQFHVPVFFVIAGYFLSDKLSFGAFVAQKARRLLLPYLATALVVIAGIAALQWIGGGSTWPGSFWNVHDTALAALYGCGSWYVPVPANIAPIGAIWFLPALFTALVISRACMRWRHGWLAAIPLAVVAFITARLFWLPLSIQPGCVGALFIVFGRFLRTREFLTSTFNWLLFLALIALFGFAGIYNWKLSLASLLTANYPPVALLTGAGSSLLLLMLSRLIDEKLAGTPASRLGDILAFYGKGSLTVLCVHLMALDLGLNAFLTTLTGLGGNPRSLLLVTAHIALTGVCIPLFRKTPGLRKLWP